MTMNIKTLATIALCGAALSTTTALAKEVKMADCPAPVQEVIQKNLRSGKLDSIKMLTVDGRTLYLADVDLAEDEDLKVYISETGELLKTREDVRQADAPAAVIEAAKKLVPEGGKLDDVEKETAGGKTTYLVEIDRPNAPDLEVTVSADGAILSQKDEASK